MYRYIFALITLIYTFSGIYAQKYNFLNYSVGEGLTQSHISSICEDSQGNLWLGSPGGGIMKYDGYTFTSYMEEDGLTNNFVRIIYSDQSGILWIGTEEGVCSFDGKSFIPLEGDDGPENKIVKVIIQDKAGDLWFGTEQNGLFRYSGTKFFHYTADNGLPDNMIHCLFSDDNGDIWIGTNRGACRYNHKDFHCYSKRDGLSTNVIRGITKDNNGNLWFATFGRGADCYDGNYFVSYTTFDGLCSNTINTIFKDNEGDLWFGTAIGISRYDGVSFKNYTEKSGLAGNVVVSIYQDASLNMWFGTSGGGISKLDNERFMHFEENENMGRWIYAIVQDTSGNMIFGTSKGGVTVYNGKDYTLFKGRDGFTYSKVKSLLLAPDNSIWFGTIGDGAYNFSNNKIFHYSRQKGLNSDLITGITTDIKGNIWFSTLDAGVCCYKKDSSGYIIFAEEDGLGSNRVYSIEADSIGNIWLGTAKGGLIRIKEITDDTAHYTITCYTKKEGLPSNTIRSIVTDSLNNIYLGTAGGGISIYSGEQFITISKKNGLRSNNIYSLIFDDNNNLWVGTGQGIDKVFLGEGFTVKACNHYGKSEGFTGVEICRNSCFKDSKGNIWFGTVNGAVRYNPVEDVVYNVPPKIHITGIRLFFDNISDTEFADSLTGWYLLPEDLVLPNDQNNLSFEFTGISLRNPDAVRYKWKLEGFDKKWSPVMSQREATYSNIPPGRYCFKVIACNEYGIWNEKPALFEFRILYPIWQKWWFITLATGIFLVVIWFIFYMRLKRIKKENWIRQEKLEMEKNIIELEQEAARLQMNPHFIFNSLNSIQGFIAQNDAFLAKRFLAKFARLMRLILENAREEYIPLGNELEMLENYLELEKLTTNNKFEYEVSIEGSIDPEATEIPPMMIQPFIENAIIHGIKNKKDTGSIRLVFRVKDELLYCEVTDNGIGRKKSAENNASTSSKRKSTGILVTKKRLEQIKVQSGLSAGVEIEDLYDENNNPAGTRVIITVPYEIY